MLIKKANGEYEEFSDRKLFGSLKRAGADSDMANEVVEFVKKGLFKGITTKKIYSMALRKLRGMDIPTASKYELKWAVMRLGRHGYAFESFIGELFAKIGYSVKLNQIIKGKCITHEVDVSAEKGSEKIFIECKHASKLGVAIDIQTALYVYARFIDLNKTFNKVYLVTNTKLTKQAIDYSECMKIGLLAWGYPAESLERIIEKYKLYPITVLHSVDDDSLNKCIEKKIVSVSDILKYSPKKLSGFLRISRKKAEEMISESTELKRS